MSRPPWPSGSGPQERGGGQGFLPALILAVLAVRLAVAASLHLTEDEAYYRLWSISPALGYFDHPPMIAWWIWLGRRLAGDTALGARLLPSLACALQTLLVFDMARLAGAGRGTSLRAAVWFNAMLLVAAGGFLAVPDAPAALFWSLSLWCALRARRGSSLAWWAGAGLAAGLAALSKYSALFLAPGVLLWLAGDAEGRAQLRRLGPWLAAILAIAVFGLNIAWNAAHHAVTFVKQFGRVTPRGFEPRYLVEFILAQAFLLNPLVAVFAARRLAGGGRRSGQRAAPAAPAGLDIAPFLFTSAPFVAYLLLHGLHDRVQAHWPAPVYPAAAILAAAGAEAAAAGTLWPRLRQATPWLGLAACLALLGLVVLRPSNAPWPDLARPLRGWPRFASRVEAARRQAGGAWIGTASYGLAAELNDEPAIDAPVFQISERTRYQDLAAPARPDLARPGLVIDLPRRLDGVALGRCFSVVRALGTLERGEPAAPGVAYAVWAVSGPRRDVLDQGC